jgi:hypothetical protein
MAYKISEEQKEWFKNNYPLLGAKGCSLKLKVSVYTCQHWANKLGIKLCHHRRSEIARKNAYSQFKKLREKRLILSQNIKINTPEKAYTLGFLWGDGHLSKANIKTDLYYINLEILEEDYNNIKKFIGQFGEWKGYTRKRNKKPTFCAALCDPVLGIFLKNNNYDKKSLRDPLKILKAIPEKFQHLWWRGYIDADGCFYVRKTIGKMGQRHGMFTMAGNINQKWDSFEKLLRTLNINYKKREDISKSGECSRIEIHNNSGIILLKKYIFKDNIDICLKRKFNKIIMY